MFHCTLGSADQVNLHRVDGEIDVGPYSVTRSFVSNTFWIKTGFNMMLNHVMLNMFFTLEVLLY